MGTHALLDPQQIREGDRRAVGGVRLGVVAERDLGRARVRVRLDEQLLTDWLPWGAWAAGRLRVWSPPTIGEQCLVLSPSGDPESGVAMPAVFQQAGSFPTPSDNPDQTLLKWDDGGYFVYDLAQHVMMLHAPCGVWIEGPLIATGDVIANAGSMSLANHVHGGVVRGISHTDSGHGGGMVPCGRAEPPI